MPVRHPAPSMSCHALACTARSPRAPFRQTSPSLTPPPWSGMVTANSLEKSSVHRGASATPIVALEQEIEEMEIEEEQLSQDARRKVRRSGSQDTRGRWAGWTHTRDSSLG